MTDRQAARKAFNSVFREMVRDGDVRQDERTFAWRIFWRGWLAHI